MHRRIVPCLVFQVLLLNVVVFATIAGLVIAEPKTWYVDDDGEADFSRIQDAVDAAISGDIIFVKGGTYIENVVVADKALTLAGEDRNTTVVDGNSKGNVFSIIGEPVAITGFTIKGATTFPHAGVFLDSANYCNISYNNILNNTHGIGLHASSNSEIRENFMANNTHFGLRLGESSSNNIAGNTITTSNVGIWLAWDSNSNILLGNNIVDNAIAGIFLSNVSDNTIRGNTIATNLHGVRLENSSNNRFYHNNFLHNNLTQAAVTTIGCANLWDDGYPVGGNYWSDHNGTDLFRSPWQNVTGRDWLADTYYVVGEENIDNYPLMGVFGPLTVMGRRTAVYLSRLVGLVFENVTVEGATTLTELPAGPEPPSGRRRVGECYDIETTAGYSGNVMVRIVYDDSDLTQEEEENLQLGQWNSTGARVVGDITGSYVWQDGQVDIRDMFKIAKLFGVTDQDPRYDVTCDLTGQTPGVPDGQINIKDLYIVAKNFGSTINQWIDITADVDTENNLIYGETTHFSIFGVH